MPIDHINLVGAGGHAAVVIDALIAAGTQRSNIEVWSDDRSETGIDLLGGAVRHLQLALLAGRVFHICIGNNGVRARIYDDLVRTGAVPTTIIHSAAVVSKLSVVGEGSFIAAGAVVGPRCELGRGAIVNHGAVVDHDCLVGEFCHVSPGSTLGGGVHLGAGVLIGAGANLLPKASVGDRAVVGAGAVVLHSVPAGATYAGVPARPLRE